MNEMAGKNTSNDKTTRLIKTIDAELEKKKKQLMLKKSTSVTSDW